MTAWPVAAVKRVADVRLGKMVQPAPSSPSDQEAPYLRAAHVQPLGRLVEVDDKAMWFSPSELRDLDLRQDDVVVVEGGAGFGRSVHLERGREGGFQNSIVRVRPKSGLSDGRFLDYVFQSLLATGRTALEASVATIPHYTAEKVSATKHRFPPLDEQQAIAEFLDRETAQIDAMIEAQRRVAELISERHEASWASTYREVLASVPTRQVRNAISSIVDGPFGSSLTSAHYVDDGGTRVIRLGNIGTNVFKDADEAYIDSDYGRTLRAHEAQPGDVIMAGLGDANNPLGRACVVPDDLGPAIVKADCYRLRPAPGILPAYLSWALSSPPVLAETRELSRGSTRARLNTTLAKSVRIAIPSPEAQAQIVSQHDSNDASVVDSLSAASEVVNLLRERREALIAAAVTGRIDPQTGAERQEEAA